MVVPIAMPRRSVVKCDRGERRVLAGAAAGVRAAEPAHRRTGEGIPIAKVESVGNDFVLVEKGDLPFKDEESLRLFAIKVCERRFGVGSDGLLVIAPNTEHRTPNTISLRMFNPDGTEDFCGNGLRCAAQYAHEKGWVGDEFTIDHQGRP